MNFDKRTRLRTGAVGIGLLFAQTALAAGGGVITVSGPTPFSKCQDEHAKVVQGAEVEPSLAVDPSDPKRIVVFYQQDRFRDGAARGVVASSSADSGRTWSRTVIKAGFCATGRTPPFRVSDPWVSIGADGRAYGLVSSYATTSNDGGRSWSEPVALAGQSDQYILDKGSLTAEPARAGVAYAVWARYRRPPRGPPVESDAMLTKTTDGGRTWSTPRVILPRSRGAGSISSIIVPDPAHDRLFHCAFWQIGSMPSLRRPSRLVVQSSLDGGSTWSAAHTIAQAYTVAGASHEAFSERQIRTGFVVPSFAVDRRTGMLYAVWQDARFSGRHYDQIVLAHSRDEGRSWSNPIRVSEAAAQAFVPTVAVSQSGTVGIAYYRTAAGHSRHRVGTTYRVALSHDHGRTFRRVTIGTAFDLATAPLMQAVPELAVPPGLFLGDYMGIAAAGDTFHLAFVRTNADKRNPTDVRYVSVPARR